MPDPQDKQQQPVQYQLPEGYDASQVIQNQPAPTNSGTVLPSGYEGSQVITNTPAATPTTPAQPAPKESWGHKAVVAVGNLVPEGAPAAAQKAEEAVGSVVPEWSIKPMQAFDKYVNQPLNKAGAWGAEKGTHLAQRAIAPFLEPSILPADRSKTPATEEQKETQTNAAIKDYPITTAIAGQLGGMAGGMITDPRMWPLMGAGEARPILQKALSGGFGVQMTKDATDAATELAATWDDITPDQRATLAARAGLSAAFATLAADHLSGGGEVGGKVDEAMKAGGSAKSKPAGAVKSAAQDLMKGKLPKREGAVVTGAEQYEPRNLPKAGAKEVSGKESKAYSPIETATEKPTAEPGLVGPEYTEKAAPETKDNLTFGERPERFEPITTELPTTPIAQGADQYDIRNLPSGTKETPAVEAKTGETKSPYGRIETMEQPKEELKTDLEKNTLGEFGAEDVEKSVNGHTITYSNEADTYYLYDKSGKEVGRFDSPEEAEKAATKGEERREGTDRRLMEQDHEGEERRKSERRVLSDMNDKAFQESAFGREGEKRIDTDAYADATAQARKELGKDASKEDVIKRRDQIVAEKGKTHVAGDIGTKSREENPEPKREEVAQAGVVKHIEDGKPFAVLQAENPHNERISDEENSKLTAQLKQELTDKGYHPVEVGGNTKDVKGVTEHAFFVPDIDADTAAEIGRKYKQEGIVTHEGLHDLKTDKVNPLDLRKGLVKGDKARAEQYYTTINGEDYHFPMDTKTEHGPINRVANRYNESVGKEPVEHSKVDLDSRREQVADAYDKAKHEPDNPKVKKAYDEFNKETMAQYEALKKAGYKLEPTKEDPYKSYEEMKKDVEDNKRLKVWTGAEPPADHPMSGIESSTGLPYNTIFRFVHDMMGHIAGDNDFSEKGEENAWKSHAQSYSDKALPAMTTETKGQTSAFFNAPDVRNGAEPHFPDQKATLLPSELYEAPKEVEKNASGESAASEEAIHRAQSEKSQGIKTYRVDTRSGHATPITGIDAADAKANAGEKIVQVKGDQITEMDSGRGSKAIDEKKLLESISPKSSREAGGSGTEAGAKRDTDILATVKKEMPNATLSEQLMEAGRRAQKAEQAAPETEAGGDNYGKVEGHVGDLSNAKLRELAKTVGIDPEKYDFSKRVPLREGGQKHPVERIQMVKDIMTKLTPEQIDQVSDQSKAASAEGIGGEPARSQKARADFAGNLFKSMLEGKSEGGRFADQPITVRQDLGKFEGKGPAPKATAETAKMSDEELKDAGFTQADIDAGKHLPKVGGGEAGAATKMAGMENIPESITKHFRDDEVAGLKTATSQETAAEQLKKVPAVQEWIDVANLGGGERKWYQRGTAAAKAIADLLPKFFDKAGDQDKFLNVVASLSPRQAIAENFTEGLRVWKELKEAEKSGIDLNEKMTTKKPTGYPQSAEWNRAGKILWDNIGMNRKAKIPNALDALSGKSALEMWPDLKDNRYFKVPSFAANLAGFLDKVTSDGWMAAFSGLKEGELSNPSSYHPLAVMTRAAADELGWEPAEAQAAIWAAVKTLTEKGTITPEGIRQYSQDFADIVKTDTQIRDMLQDMGVDLKELDGKLDKIEGRPEVTSRGTPSTEDSVRKLTKRLEKQGREIPEGTPIERSQDEARIRELSSEKPTKLGKATDDTSFNPEEFEEKKDRPITDSLIKKYGTTKEPYTAAQFITEDGSRIPVQDHDHAVRQALGKKKIESEDRVNYINDENAIRMRTRSGRNAAHEVVFSVPESGVSDDQIKAMKETVKKMGPHMSMAFIEEANPKSGNYVTLTNPKPENVDSAIKELKKPKWSPLVRAFHAQ